MPGDIGSAAAGYPPAVEELGLILLSRARGAVEKQAPALFEQADRQLLLAAELGSIRAQRELGLIRAEGVGRLPDSVDG